MSAVPAEGRRRPRARDVAAGATVGLVVVVGVVWALWSPLTRIPDHIAVEAAPSYEWQGTVRPDPEERGSVGGLPLLGDLVAPARGEWVWRVDGAAEDVAPAVAAWLLQRPVPEGIDEGAPIDVAPTRAHEGRSWDGRIAAGGTTTLRGTAASAFRSVTVTVVITPLPVADGFTQVTVRVE